MAPQLLFGTASFGMTLTDFQDASSISNLLAFLKKHGITRLDSAARYPPMFPGRAEQLLGESREQSHQFVIDTKVLTGGADASGNLSRAAMSKSVNDSLARLKLEKVNVLYAHSPDPATPLEEQARAFNEQLQLGHCEAYGLSNYSAEQIEDFVQVCDKLGLKKPTVYQGAYNVITRGAETSLMPTLKKHGIAFVAFAPLAMGFMSAKLANGDAQGTRMGEDSPIRKPLQTIYGDARLHEAVRIFQSAVEAQGLSTIEVSLRWIVYHSALADTDGVILGASKSHQLEGSLEFTEKGRLSDTVLAEVEKLWERVKDIHG